MNFDVTKVIGQNPIDKTEDLPTRTAPVVARAQQRSIPKKESPLEKLEKKNSEYDGVSVERVSKKGGLLTPEMRDVKDAMESLPDTLADMNNLSARIATSKKRLGLGEGGFVDQEVEIFNYQTHKIEGTRWMTSKEINSEFIMREPIMTDEELDEFLKMYFVEFDIKTGEVKPRRYPNTKGLKCSVVFPNAQASTKTTTSEPIRSSEPSKNNVVELPKTDNPTEEPDTFNQRSVEKVKYIVKEKVATIRKKLNESQLVELSEMVLDRNSVPCTAVASRYKCDITAVTYEEFDQIRSMVETSDLSRETKMWSVVYRHVKNPTIGEFKSFQDFCDHTAWVDRRRFWFALMCTMNRDKDKVTLNCLSTVWKPMTDPNGKTYDISKYKEAYLDINDISKLPTMAEEVDDMNVYATINIGSDMYHYIPTKDSEISTVVKWVQAEHLEPCNNRYDHEYYNRSLIDTDNQESWVTKEIEAINSFTAMNEAIEYHEAGALRSKRNIAITDKISLDVGIKSVSDVLRNDYKYMVSESLIESMKKEAIKYIKSLRGETYDPTEEEIVQYIQEDMSESAMLPLIGMSVIDKLVVNIEGEEYESDSDDDIINTIKNCPPKAIRVLYNGDTKNTIMHRYNTSYEPTFSYKGCKCPVCGAEVSVPIERVEDLVFTLSQSSEITTFDIAEL